MATNKHYGVRGTKIEGNETEIAVACTCTEILIPTIPAETKVGFKTVDGLIEAHFIHTYEVDEAVVERYAPLMAAVKEAAAKLSEDDQLMVEAASDGQIAFTFWRSRTPEGAVINFKKAFGIKDAPVAEGTVAEMVEAGMAAIETALGKDDEVVIDLSQEPATEAEAAEALAEDLADEVPVPDEPRPADSFEVEGAKAEAAEAALAIDAEAVAEGVDHDTAAEALAVEAPAKPAPARRNRNNRKTAAA